MSDLTDAAYIAAQNATTDAQIQYKIAQVAYVQSLIDTKAFQDASIAIAQSREALDVDRNRMMQIQLDLLAKEDSTVDEGQAAAILIKLMERRLGGVSPISTNTSPSSFTHPVMMVADARALSAEFVRTRAAAAKP